jgi:hypothetical protein
MDYRYHLFIGFHFFFNLTYFNLVLIKEYKKKIYNCYFFGFYNASSFFLSHLGFTCQILHFLSVGKLLITNILVHHFFLNMFNSLLFQRLDSWAIYFLFTFCNRPYKKNLKQILSIIQPTANQNSVNTLGLRASGDWLQEWSYKKHSVFYSVLKQQPFQLTTLNHVVHNNPNSCIQIPIQNAYTYYGQYVNTNGVMQNTVPCPIFNTANQYPFYKILQQLYLKPTTRLTILKHKIHLLFRQENKIDSIFTLLASQPLFGIAYCFNTPFCYLLTK